MLLLFVFSAMGSKLFGERHSEAFGSLGVSDLSFFTVMTLEGWPDLAREVMRTHPMAWSIFIVLSRWAVLNLVIGVVVDVLRARQEEELEIEVMRNQVTMMDEPAAMRREQEDLRNAERPTNRYDFAGHRL